jgi:hypothetical protein
MTKKRLPGRPFTPLAKKRDSRVVAYLTAAEKRTVQEAADADGLELATWARKRLLEAAAEKAVK